MCLVSLLISTKNTCLFKTCFLFFSRSFSLLQFAKHECQVTKTSQQELEGWRYSLVWLVYFCGYSVGVSFSTSPLPYLTRHSRFPSQRGELAGKELAVSAIWYIEIFPQIWRLMGNFVSTLCTCAKHCGTKRQFSWRIQEQLTHW